jgi:hypothetical protein
MTTPELDEQLREHYGSFHRDHAVMRERLLEHLRAEERSASPHRETTSRFFNRRLIMRLSAAAVVGLVVGTILFLVNPGPQGTTWADVVKAIGPIESVQYSTIEPFAPLHEGGPLRRTTTRNYATADAVRVDTWAGHDVDRGPEASAGLAPTLSRLTRASGREIATYVVNNENGRPNSIQQSVDYTAASPELGDPRKSDEDLRPSSDVLAMWRRLQDLQPESVLKRGSQEVNGQKLLRFEVIDAFSIPGLAGFQSGAFILVDPKSKQPVKLETGSLTWTDLRFNQTIPQDKFAPPTVPDDLDASVVWRFTLLAEAWNDPRFVFRVLDAQGKPIVTKADVQVQPAPTGGGGGSGLFGGAVPGGAGVVPQRLEDGVTSLQGFLSREGIDKLDKFMARNPGAEMTIEITGEPPIKRKVYGRLTRNPSETPVSFKLPSRADAKAATQPSAHEAASEEMGGEGLIAPGSPGRFAPPRPGARRGR